MDSPRSTTAFVLRLIAGVLALVAFGLTGLRLYSLSVLGLLMGPDSLKYALGLLFPLSLGLIFGYLAWKGRLPFSQDDQHSRE